MTLKVLWYSDFLCGSGFARVAHELVRRLDASGEYEFHVQAIGYSSEPANHPKSPYYDLRHIPVHPPAEPRRLLERLASEHFDALFVLANPWDVMRIGPQLRALSRAKGFKIVFYFPIEEACDPWWVRHAIGLAHRPVAYTHFGARQIREASGLECQVIYHGVDADTFRMPYPGERDELRESLWGVGPEQLVIVNVNRNQPRKDLPRSMLVAAEVAKLQKRQVVLYLHADPNDVAGADLHSFQRRWIPNSVQVIYGRTRAISDEKLARVYAAGDVLISTALCEGWGLSTTEAMACGLPVIVPNCSVFPELVGHGERGQLVATDGFTMLPKQSGLFKLTSVKAMAECVVDWLKEPEAQKRAAAERARAWVVEHCNWDSIAHEWHRVFQSVKLERQREALEKQPVDPGSPSQVQ